MTSRDQRRAWVLTCSEPGNAANVRVRSAPTRVARFEAHQMPRPLRSRSTALAVCVHDQPGSRYRQLQRGIATILLGGDPPASVAWEPLPTQYAKWILVGVVVLQLAGIGWGIRNLRRWRDSRLAAPHGWLAMIRHLALPLVVDLAIPGAILWLVLSQFGPRVEFLWVLPRWFPDIGPTFVLIILIGVGWGLLRTVLNARVWGGAA